MEDEADILIIGAGAAGLAAARELSVAGFRVIILEARNRIGGRINTHFDRFPMELGAEFVHGEPPETLTIVERAHLALQEIPNRHWYLDNGILTRSSEFWSKVEDVMTEMSRYTGPDQGFIRTTGREIHLPRALIVIFRSVETMRRQSWGNRWKTRCSLQVRQQTRMVIMGPCTARLPPDYVQRERLRTSLRNSVSLCVSAVRNRLPQRRRGTQRLRRE